ncbi:LuxR family transcriptional regulator [Gordonia sp. TBRC 11910]|uniref:LuxR family transcriptional regulator n=1 Tax=Gordonia asplenii TaxID=2725283 RepID=A0A848L2K7_9ACTN|nr:LuxR C-terminal-related transcriptional regulator [Gordonia asplenii]NMO04662.1 LuxR family transcriptional regulator [Gordonia asplenii]
MISSDTGSDTTVTGGQATPRLLLETRFAPSAPARKTIRRGRLLDILRAAADVPLTLIHAPAGFGKSTLAVQWYRHLRESGADVAWLSIVGDEGAESFLAHLIASIGLGDPDVVGDLADLLDQQGPGIERIVATALINAISERGRPFTLIIDDWHRITRTETIDLVEFLIDNGGAHLHVMVTSRVRSGLPLSRLRLHEKLCEVDTTDLRFDTGESRELLVDICGLPLPDSSVASLAKSTDGWAAALHLAALSLRGSPSSSLIGDIAGGQRAVGEFLADNVVNALDDDLLDFLMVTSLTERICGSLAVALSGRSDGPDVLDEVERRDLFLERLDDHRQWFRYHHLFADFLRHRLAMADPDRVVRLHAIATDWFAERGMLTDALDHALAGGQVDVAADLVEAEAMALIENSRMAAVLELIGRLPVGAVAERPRLLMASAWANCLLQRLAPAQQSLDQLRYSFSLIAADDGAQELESEADVVQACIDVFADRIDRADRLVDQTIAEPTRVRAFVVAVAANIRTVVLVRNAEFSSARQLQGWARIFQDRITGQFPGVYGRCLAGIAATDELDTDAGEAHLREAVRIAQESAGIRSHAAQLAGALLASSEYERGRIDAAESLVQEGRRYGVEGGLVEFMIASYTTLARIHRLRGDPAAGLHLLAEGIDLADRLGLARLSAWMLHEQVRAMVSAGDLHRATQSARAIPDGERFSGGVASEIGRLRVQSMALVASAGGQHDTAIRELDRLLADTCRRSHPYDEVRVRIQLAGAQELAGRRNQAMRTLAPAVRAGANAGLQRSFLDAGEPARSVLEHIADLVDHDAWPDPDVPINYVKQLLARSGRLSTHAVLSPELRSLSARELDILRLVGGGLSNRRVAEELHVTVNTVKWHLKNINTKLGVSNRMESVGLVRRSGLLD